MAVLKNFRIIWVSQGKIIVNSSGVVCDIDSLNYCIEACAENDVLVSVIACTSI